MVGSIGQAKARSQNLEFALREATRSDFATQRLLFSNQSFSCFPGPDSTEEII